MPEIDENHHITRTQAGNTETLGPIVQKYHRRVEDPEIAKDLTQETWLKALRDIKRFRGESAFSSWLYRIAENVCLDHFRRQKHDTEPLHLVRAL